jgi:hypothetical protein
MTEREILSNLQAIIKDADVTPMNEAGSLLYLVPRTLRSSLTLIPFLLLSP